jgi:predicted transcriptional regulator
MKQAQAQKLLLLERIAGLQDPAMIKKMATFLEQEEALAILPPKEVLLARARAGQAEIEAGHFVTLEESLASLEAAHQEGLRQRKALGKNA